LAFSSTLHLFSLDGGEYEFDFALLQSFRTRIDRQIHRQLDPRLQHVGNSSAPHCHATDPGANSGDYGAVLTCVIAAPPAIAAAP